jgi:hypothetical protein
MLGRNESIGHSRAAVSSRVRLSARRWVILPALVGFLLGCASRSWTKTQGVAPNEIARVQSLVDGLNSSQPPALARALGAELATENEDPLPEEDCLVALGGLSEGKSPMLVFKWTPRPDAPAGANAQESPVSVWRLFLLAWKGRRWESRGLMSGYEPVAVRALPVESDGGALIAVVIHSPSDDVSYPVIFRVPGAALAWDSRGDESRYEGYRGGQVRFQVAKGSLEMVETGRADPGLLVFSGQGARGFQARSIYVWESGAFIPRRTEYSQNPDFTLYRFISALHLHDFPAAYALVDPHLFLRTGQPSLELFRRRIEDAWPEFLDDHIFKARDGNSGDWTFTLRLQDKLDVYTPSFSDDSPWLLTGLERSEQKPESE